MLPSNIRIILSSLFLSITVNGLTFETDDPKEEIPQAIVVRGEGTIVDPDTWTAMPSASPIVTIPPTSHPTVTTLAPTPHVMMLMTRGRRKQCPGDTDVDENECLDAALEVIRSDDEAENYQFPYHLNVITSNDMPCGCFFEHDDTKEGDLVLVNYNNIGTGNCARHDDAQLICGGCGSAVDKQSDYRGTISVTENGNLCSVWRDTAGSAYDPYGVDTGEGLRGKKNNYCRNPHGNKDKAWCYTSTTPSRRRLTTETDETSVEEDNTSRKLAAEASWEYCNVPYC